jgi:hypothetical protein
VTTTDGTVTVQIPTATPTVTATATFTSTPTATPTPTETSDSISASFGSVADAFARMVNPSSNFGGQPDMEVCGTSTAVDRSLVQFDISSIPAGSTVVSATLRLCYKNDPTAAVGHVHELRQVTSAWTEAGVTWNTQPTVSGSVTSTVVVPPAQTCVSFAVTADVQAWVDGMSNYGWRLNDANETLSSPSNSKYVTREDSAPADRPRLDVTYTPP